MYVERRRLPRPSFPHESIIFIEIGITRLTSLMLSFINDIGGCIFYKRYLVIWKGV